MEKLTDSSLGKVIKNYEDQLLIVRDDEKKISALEAKKKLTKQEQQALQQLHQQHTEDVDDLKSWEQDVKDAVKELKQRGITVGKMTKTVAKQVVRRAEPEVYHRASTVRVPFNQSRRGYMISIKRWLSSALSAEELRAAEAKLSATNSIEQMKRIYDHYRQLALNRAPSTQAITSEQIEQEAAEDPREEAVLKLQKFARSMKGKHTVLPKPPKHVSIKHQPLPINEIAPELDIVEGDLLKKW